MLKELEFLCYSVVLGAMMMSFYDIFRFLRIVISHKRWVEYLEDIFYWCVCGVAIFYLYYRENNGAIRIFAVLGISAGMLAYQQIISRVFFGVISKMIRWQKRRKKLDKISKKSLKKCIKRVNMVISRR